MTYGKFKKIFFSFLLLTSPVSQATIIHQYDVTVSEYDFRGPGFYSLNSERNPNSVFYKFLFDDAFTILSNEEYSFVFDFDQTIWLYDLGLPYGVDDELVGPSLLLDRSLGNTDLYLYVVSYTVELEGFNSNYDPVFWSYLGSPGGYGGSGFSPSAWTDITSYVMGINSMVVSFNTGVVDYNGGSDMFDSIHLRIIGDDVSLVGPISVSEPYTLALLLGALLLMRRQSGK